MIIDELFEAPQQCPECGGISFSDLILAEKKDACYHKVKASAKVWPSAYASGRLVQCRKKGAGNYGNKSESVAEDKSNAMVNTASRLANKDDGKVVKLRAAGDKRREDQLKGRDIAKRDCTSKDEWGYLKQGVAEATGDKPFDKMMTTIKQGTNKQKTADRKEQQKQTQQRARDAFGNMFGGGNPADKLSVREQGVAEEYELAGVGVAYELGRRAYQERKTIKDNPYSATREARKYDEWEKGLERGKHDANDARLFRSSVREQDVAEDNLNELDMFAPVTTYVRLANGTYVAANWRRNQDLSTASNSASFIDIKPLAPAAAKQLGLDQRLNDPEKKYTGAATIASGGPIQASGPLADRTINVVDIRDPKAAKDSGVPDTLFGKIAQWAQQQDQKQPGVEEGEQQKGADYRDPKEVDYDDEYDDMVARVKKLAGLGPMKTVYDPARRQYRNMPTAVQPKK